MNLPVTIIGVPRPCLNSRAFWSRTKKRLWTKGETSGHFLKVVDVLADCDADTLLIMADPIGPTCHTLANSCFDEKGKDGIEMGRNLTQEIWEMNKAFSAVEPDGSMKTKILDLNFQAGYRIIMPNQRSNMGTCDDPAISEFYLQRPQEIPALVAAGRFDLGIAAVDVIEESGEKIIELARLPISRQTDKRARIALVVSCESGYRSLDDLPSNCSIYTEYVRITEKYLADNNRSDIKVIFSRGNTEEKIKLFGAAAIVELVETGSSLLANDLIEIDLIMETEMVVITNQEAFANTYKRARMECYVRSLLGALRAKDYVRLEANVPELLIDQAAKIMGGLKGPTISPLTLSGWSALISIVEVSSQNRIIAELLAIGVTDICRSEIPLLMI